MNETETLFLANADLHGNADQAHMALEIDRTDRFEDIKHKS
jgi:hypothetical protein